MTKFLSLSGLQTFWGDIVQMVDSKITNMPTMSTTTKGGAKLGSGLKVEGDTLSLGDIVTDETDGPIYSVDAEGWAEQDGTPTPENPVEIKVARGRNLFDKDNPNTLDGYFSGSATSISGSSNHKCVYVPCEPNTTYTLSNSSNNRVSIAWSSSTPTVGSSISGNTNGVITTGADAKYLVAYVYNSTDAGGPTWQQVLDTIQLELGSAPTPYVPYGHVGLDVQGGKNLFDKTIVLMGHYIAYADGGLDTNGNYVVSDYIPVEAGKPYTISGMTNPSGATYLVWTDSNKTAISAIRTGNGTYTAPANAVFFRTSVLNVDVDTFQFEQSSTATSYESHYHETRPIPLPSKGFAASLPDGTADTLAIDSAGRWEWENETDEVEVDSTNLSSSFAPTLYPDVRHVVLNIFAAIKPGAILSDMFVRYQGSFRGDASGEELCGIYDGNGSVRFNVNPSRLSADSEDGVRAWMDTNKPKILYPLATPTTEHGYVDLPEIPEGSTITIPELELVGVRCFVPGARELAEHAANWAKRSEYENEQIEDAIAELVDRVAALES